MSQNKVIVIGIILALISILIANYSIEQAKEPVKVYKFKGGGEDGMIESRTKITSDMIYETTVPKKGRHPQAVLDKEKILGETVFTNVFNNQQVISSALRSTKDSQTLSYYVSEDKRAVSIPANSSMSFGGELTKDDRIDVVANITQLGNQQVSLTQTVLRNIPIIELSKGMNDQINLIVVEVTPEQAEMLHFVKQFSKINVNLVPDNADIRKTKGIVPTEFINHFGRNL